MLGLEFCWDRSAAEITALIAFVLLVHLAPNSGPPLTISHTYLEKENSIEVPNNWKEDYM